VPGLRRVSAHDTIGALERLGFVRVRQRGSHVVLRRQTGEREVGCVVPLHRELAVGTLHGILRQAKVTPDEIGQRFLVVRQCHQPSRPNRRRHADVCAMAHTEDGWQR